MTMEHKTGLVYSDIYLEHDTGGHPESGRRLTAIMDGLRSRGILNHLFGIEPRAAEPSEIEMVHDPAYVAWAQEMSRRGVRLLDGIETVVSPGSYRAALYAAGGVLSAVDAVMAGTVRNCFCAVRPPGHHALADRAMGFCVFNNTAIGARYVQRKYSLRRVVIVDWDVHHGNGTQDAFYADRSVFYFSVHQFPHYPGSGSAEETGTGKGEGYTLNVPLPAGSGDREYLSVFRDQLVPAMDRFRPEFVFISAGFDGHRRDPLAGMDLTDAGYAGLTSLVADIADEYALGRLVSVLEGGYDLDALSSSIAAHARTLLDVGR